MLAGRQRDFSARRESFDRSPSSCCRRRLDAPTQNTNGEDRKMRTLALTTTLCLTVAAGFPAMAAGKYPPIAEYMMAKDAEMALAQTAAPAAITEHATVKVLTASGYAPAREGD